MDESELYGIIYDVMTNQQFGILATVENGIPHTSIVAFTVTNNLRTILFLTKQESRKFKHISTNPMVSILVDKRPVSSKSISGSYAVSAVGNAKVIDLKSASATKELFLFCHPTLTEYIDDPAFSLLSISVNTYNITSGLKDTLSYKMG
jgi:general stress protein 26